MADKDKEERSLLDQLRYMLSLPEKAMKKDWDGIYEKIQKKIAKWSEK